MIETFDVDVLIAGAGPTGLTLAIELARRGVPVRLIDRAQRYFDGSRGDGVQPRTLEVFEDLGVLPRVRAEGGLLPPLRVYRDGEVVMQGRMFDPVPPTPDVPYPNPWAIAQWRTERILRDRLADLGGRVELATELTGFTQDDTGVTAELASGEIVRARYLVGADGGRSVVRRTLGVPFAGETDESVRMLIADLRVDGLDLDYGHFWPLPGTGQLLGFTPIVGTGMFVLTRALRPDEEPDLSLPALQKMVDEASGRSDLELYDLGWHTVWRPNIRMVRQFRVGRVFLAGDAAHVHPPTGGQGLNTGIQDGYNLGWKLAAALAGGSPRLLDSYQAERLPVAESVLGLSTRLLKKHVDGDADAHRRGRDAQQLDLSYAGGPLAADSRARPGAVVAGDRAPDAPVRDAKGDPVRLFEFFAGPQWTLLVFGENRGEVVRTVNDRYPGTVCAVAVSGSESGPDILTDVDGHARDAYAVSGEVIVLIRPDGYIGLFAEPGTSADVSEYLDRLLV